MLRNSLPAALHLAATLWMTGLVWCVQVVHYPLMSFVERSRHPHFAQQHARRIGWIVAPVMLLELATNILLAIQPSYHQAAWRTALVLLACIWISTFTLQVPLHNRLAHGFDETAHRKLVLTNWIRTLLWSARSILAVRLLMP